MKFTTLIATGLLALAPISALADTIEVKMLNRGETGNMVFEPHFVSAQIGDTVVFLPTDRGHNAETVDGMVPEGQDAFVGGINEEIAIELTADGMIGVKCKPHLGMGMVMVIQVGAAEMPADFLEAKLPRKAKSTFEDILTEVTAN